MEMVGQAVAGDLTVVVVVGWWLVVEMVGLKVAGERAMQCLGRSVLTPGATMRDAYALYTVSSFFILHIVFSFLILPNK